MKILSISTYPVDAPRHGGQRRTAAIHEALREAGHEHRNLCVYQKEGYPESQEDAFSFALPSEEFGALLARNKRADAHISELILGNPERRARFKSILERFQPDIIQHEQPWGFPVVEALLAELPELSPRHVYSSQNVESALMERILTLEGHPESARIRDEVDQLERRLLEAASLTVVVSEDDRKAFAARAPAGPVVLAPNGSAPPAAGEAAESAWRESRAPGSRHAIFVGSAHPPNAQGFMEMLGPNLGYVPYPHRLVVAGGVVHLLASPWNRFGALNESILERRPGPSDEELGAMLTSAAAVLLPITEGGGSNLKTAEALLSDRPVVATTLAFRGFEAMKDQPGVFIADDPESFKKKVGELLERGDPAPCGRDPAALDRLRWDACLAPMVEAIARLT